MKTHKELKEEQMTHFIEAGAAIEHARWSKWQAYLHSLCIKNLDGSLTIPAWQVERAERQIATEYKDLSEKEKESDRKEVRSYLSLLSRAIDEAAEGAAEASVLEKDDRHHNDSDMQAFQIIWNIAALKSSRQLDKHFGRLADKK